MEEHQRSITIKCESLVKEYNKLSRTRALRDVSLDIFAGDYVMLFGPSGCGKSTLLNIIAGLEVPTTGKVYLRGKDLFTLSEKEIAKYHRSKIGLVFQQFSFFKTLTVIENVYFPRLLAGVSMRLRKRRAMHLLEVFGIAEFANHFPQELSGGQQQRLAIARALVNNPWILLIDEPTGSLDKKAGGEIMDIICNLNKISKRTILLVTHNPEYLHYADRILHMEDGKIIREERNEHTPIANSTLPAEKLNEESLEKVN